MKEIQERGVTFCLGVHDIAVLGEKTAVVDFTLACCVVLAHTHTDIYPHNVTILESHFNTENIVRGAFSQHFFFR